jgi:hypothetical protein
MAPACCEQRVRNIETETVKTKTFIIGLNEKHTFGDILIQGTESGFMKKKPDGSREYVCYDDVDDHDSVDNARCIHLPNGTVYIKAIPK